MDDGSPNLKETEKLLKMSWNQGVTDLIVTPHFSRNLDPERLADCFETVRNTAEKVTPGLHLFLGQEILYFEEMVDCLLQGKALTLAESRYVYAFQDFNDIPGTLPEGRTKLWGTGQAVLAAKDVIKTPFIVINADDYYGKEGFKAVHEYLVNGGKSCMAGFILKNTLSDNGGVTRGICKMDEQNNLTEVVETKNIVKTATGAEADGVDIDTNSLVSMNMWGLTPEFLDVLEEGFKEFFEKEVPDNPLKAEHLIPIFIGELLEQGKMSVKVLKTNDIWYGMTYHEDVAAVKDSFKKMLVDGMYKADLFSNL